MRLMAAIAEDNLLGPFAGCSRVSPRRTGDVLKWAGAASHMYDAASTRPAAFADAVATALGRGITGATVASAN